MIAEEMLADDENVVTVDFQGLSVLKIFDDAEVDATSTAELGELIDNLPPVEDTISGEGEDLAGEDDGDFSIDFDDISTGPFENQDSSDPGDVIDVDSYSGPEDRFDSETLQELHDVGWDTYEEENPAADLRINYLDLFDPEEQELDTEAASFDFETEALELDIDSDDDVEAQDQGDIVDLTDDYDYTGAIDLPEEAVHAFEFEDTFGIDDDFSEHVVVDPLGESFGDFVTEIDEEFFIDSQEDVLDGFAEVDFV